MPGSSCDSAVIGSKFFVWHADCIITHMKGNLSCWCLLCTLCGSNIQDFYYLFQSAQRFECWLMLSLFVNKCIYFTPVDWTLIWSIKGNRVHFVIISRSGNTDKGKTRFKRQEQFQTLRDMPGTSEGKKISVKIWFMRTALLTDIRAHCYQVGWCWCGIDVECSWGPKFVSYLGYWLSFLRYLVVVIKTVQENGRIIY